MICKRIYPASIACRRANDELSLQIASEKLQQLRNERERIKADIQLRK